MTRDHFLLTLAGLVLAGALIVPLLVALPLRAIRGTFDPAYAPAPAGLAVRLAAAVIDAEIIAAAAAVLLGAVMLLDLPSPTGAAFLLSAIASTILLTLAYFSIPYAYGVQTPGKRIAGLRLERRDGTPCRGAEALWRAVLLAIFAGSGIILLDMAALALHAQKRALHDLLAGSRVVQIIRPPRLLALAPLMPVGVFVMLFVIAALLFSDVYLIPSSSMTPTLLVGDRIVINHFTTRKRAVQRGDLIVFRAPYPMHVPGNSVPDEKMLKRVIALPGETVLITAHDGIYINGLRFADTLPVPEYNWPERTAGAPGHPYTLGTDEYFVLGDNRKASIDSHIWRDASTGRLLPGVPRENIIGKAVLVCWPPQRISALP